MITLNYSIGIVLHSPLLAQQMGRNICFSVFWDNIPTLINQNADTIMQNELSADIPDDLYDFIYQFLDPLDYVENCFICNEDELNNLKLHCVFVKQTSNEHFYS
mgnify:CR=1 FL=1